MVVADVDNVRGVPPPVLNVVDVAVMFQRLAYPVAAPASQVCDALPGWAAPFKVAAKLTVDGLETKARLPAVIAADAEVAPAGAAMLTTPSAAIASATATWRRGFGRDFIMVPLLVVATLIASNVSRGNLGVA
jgi:hypothetical protein